MLNACDHVPWSTWIKAMPNSLLIDFGLKSNQLPWWNIKTMLKNKQCPKILQPLLINSKYSLDHDPPSWGFY